VHEHYRLRQRFADQEIEGLSEQASVLRTQRESQVTLTEPGGQQPHFALQDFRAVRRQFSGGRFTPQLNQGQRRKRLAVEQIWLPASVQARQHVGTAQILK
jgi:hypothetical protein